MRINSRHALRIVEIDIQAGTQLLTRLVQLAEIDPTFAGIKALSVALSNPHARHASGLGSKTMRAAQQMEQLHEALAEWVQALKVRMPEGLAPFHRPGG